MHGPAPVILPAPMASGLWERYTANGFDQKTTYRDVVCSQIGPRTGWGLDGAGETASGMAPATMLLSTMGVDADGGIGITRV